MAAYRHFGCRITDDLLYKGMRTFFLENELIRIGVLLDKGTDLFQFLHKPTDTDFLWRAPRGLHNPQQLVATRASAAGAFLDGYHGGWQEILPGGGPYDAQGAEIGLHGEVTHLPWDWRIVTDDADCVEVECSVECVRTPLRLVKRMRLEAGKPSVFIEEEVVNLASAPHSFMWGHHPAFGAPFLSEKVRLLVPAQQAEVHAPRFAASGIFEPGARFAWPHAPAGNRIVDLSRIGAPDAGYADLIYLSELREGWCALLDTERRLGIAMAWDVNVMPYLWFWLVYGRAPGYPWWDRVYCVALEPWTSAPNSFAAARDAGTLTQLDGHGRRRFALTASVITDRIDVTSVDRNGTVR